MSGSGTGIVTPYNTHRAMDFDGAADNYLRAADLVGNADGALGIASIWFRVDGGDGTNRAIFVSNTFNFLIYLDAGNRFWVRARTAVPVTVLELVTTPTYLAGSGWHHALVSWTLIGVTANIYMDGAVPALTTNTVNLGVIDYAGGIAWAVASTTGGAQRWNGALSECYVNFAENTNLALLANRDLWRHPNGQPPNIAADGSGPTGNQPIGYFVEEGGVMVNRGSGGVFGAVGAPALSADSPKDRWVASLNYQRRKRIRAA